MKTLPLFFLLFSLSAPADIKMGTVYEIKDTWVTSEGKEIRLSQWRDQTLVVSLFYTSCRAICPMTVSRMKKVEKKFGERAKDMQFILFTIDPQRDRAEDMAKFKEKQGIDRPNWHLIASDEKASRKLAAVLGMGFSEPQANRDLHQMHTRKIVLVRTVGEGQKKKVTYTEVTDDNLDELTK